MPDLTSDAQTRAAAPAPPRSRGWLPTAAAAAHRRRLLALADALAATIAILSLAYVDGGSIADAAASLAFVPVWIVLAKLYGLYDRDQRVLRHLTVDELPAIAASTTTSTALFVLVSNASGVVPNVATGVAVRIWAIALTLTVALRIAARYAWRRVTPAERTLLVGGSEAREAVRRKLELFPDIHLRIVDEQSDLDLDEVAAGASAGAVDRVVLADATLDGQRIRELADICRTRRVRLSVLSPEGVLGLAAEINRVAELAFIEYGTWDVSRSTLLLKRVLDLLVSVPAVVVLAPVFAAVAIAIKVDSPGPVILRQVRAGRGGRPYRMLKFRTMVENADDLLDDLVDLDDLPEPMYKLEGDPRVTRVGRFLRRWSIDELPQLLNVVGGSMTLVGPRPERLELVARYGPEHRFRLEVKPGMTGPMQVFGRGALTFSERLAVEREYIENLSLRRDLRILGMTVAAVVSGRGAY